MQTIPKPWEEDGGIHALMVCIDMIYAVILKMLIANDMGGVAHTVEAARVTIGYQVSFHTCHERNVMNSGHLQIVLVYFSNMRVS